MRKLWFALLFLAGGLSHEIRNPIGCDCITSRQQVQPRKRAARQIRRA